MEQSMLIYYMIIALATIFWLICLYITRNKEYPLDTILFVIWTIVVFLVTLTYPYFTIEYENGYNDYPDNTTYIEAKEIVGDSCTASWYCDGWEKAQKEEAKLTFEELKHKISRKVVN